MRKAVIIGLCLVLAIPSFADNVKTRTRDYPQYRAYGTDSDPVWTGSALEGTPPHNNGATLDDPIGTVYEAGVTYYDYQSNGSCGNAITVDAEGYVQMVWMNGLTVDPAGSRKVFYNRWNPSSQAFEIAGGVAASQSSRSGYCTIASTADGWAYPTYHEKPSDDATRNHGAVAIDFLPRQGSFTSFPIQPYMPDFDGLPMESIWPRVAIDRQGRVHVATTQAPRTGLPPATPQMTFYSRGVPVFDGDGFGLRVDWDDVGTAPYPKWKFMDTVEVIAPVVACSRISDKVVYAWLHCRDFPPDCTQINNDVYYRVSLDGGNTWGQTVNLTNFIAPDTICAGAQTFEDSLVCDNDTMKAYCDVDAIFDDQDRLHISFTTMNWMEFTNLFYYFSAQVWEWNDRDQVFTPIDNHMDAGTGWTAVNPNSTLRTLGAFQRAAQRPNFAIDTVTNYLYLAYQRYDTGSSSSNGYGEADVFMSVSTDGGSRWSEGINVTNTSGGQGAAPGNGRHEREPTLADYVSYVDGTGYLSLSYVLDLDAGAAIRDDPAEGVVTLNPAKFQRIPVNLIPTTPLRDNLYPIMHVDTTGWPGLAIDDHQQYTRPEEFRLFQNYPNPFNPTTNIQFDLTRDASVTLRVFNVLGQEVAMLLDNARMDAGTKVVPFDASGLASGVYMYKLEANGVSAVRKMILMK